MTTAPVAFVDIETTGLDVDRHDIFEIAIIADEEEYVWAMAPHLENADPTALRITRFYERFEPSAQKVFQPRPLVAAQVARALAGRNIVGAVPSFDARFLEPFLRAYGQAPAWHYHLVDVEALAAGMLGVEPPWDSADLAAKVGVHPDDVRFAKHTALGDARWAKAIYEAVLVRGRWRGETPMADPAVVAGYLATEPVVGPMCDECPHAMTEHGPRAGCLNYVTDRDPSPYCPCMVRGADPDDIPVPV